MKCVNHSYVGVVDPDVLIRSLDLRVSILDVSIFLNNISLKVHSVSIQMIYPVTSLHDSRMGGRLIQREKLIIEWTGLYIILLLPFLLLSQTRVDLIISAA